LPGGKINIQRFLKQSFASAGTEIVDSSNDYQISRIDTQYFWEIVGDIGHSESLKLYLSRIIIDAFLFLERDVSKILHGNVQRISV